MDKATELIHQIRHYGTLRFAMFTVFLGVTAGLLTAFYQSSSGAGRFFLMVFGIGAAIIFGLLQTKLSALHHGCVRGLRKLAEDSRELEEGFIDILFGGADLVPFEAWLYRMRNSLASRFEEEAIEFVGPVTLSVLFIHLLVAILWGILFLFEVLF